MCFYSPFLFKDCLCLWFANKWYKIKNNWRDKWEGGGGRRKIKTKMRGLQWIYLGQPLCFPPSWINIQKRKLKTHTQTNWAAATEWFQCTGLILQSNKIKISVIKKWIPHTSHLIVYRTFIYIFLFLTIKNESSLHDNRTGQQLAGLLSVTGFLLDVGQRDSPLSPPAALWRGCSGWRWRCWIFSLLFDPVECGNLTRNWITFCLNECTYIVYNYTYISYIHSI